MSARILFLHHTAIIGGAELHLLSIARHFRENSQVILFADGPFRPALEAADVRVQTWPNEWSETGARKDNPRFSAGNMAAVARLAWLTAQAACDHDLIYANSPRALFVSSIASLVRRKPVIWFLHDLLDQTHFSRRALRLIVAVANRSASRIVANSRATAASFIAAGGCDDLIRIVNNGCDPAPFSVLPVDLGFAGERVIGVFGRLIRWKGQDVVLRALARVQPAVALFVGDEEDATYARELRHLAAELGIAERVRFLGFRGDVPALMRSVDCIVHASIDPEPFGRVIVEGMLAQRPVIASRGGGVPEIIQEGESGLLFTPGNSEELATAITRVFANPAEAVRLAENGYRRALELFTEERMLREIEQQLNETAFAR